MKKLLTLLALFACIPAHGQVITTIAGNGTPGATGDGGPATAALLNYPIGVCADGSGNIYVGDYDNFRVRMISPAGIITTFAGGGATLGDGGPATAALLSFPSGVCTDGSGNVYITGDSRIRKVNPAGIITTFAGNGIARYSGDGGQATAARLNSLSMVFADGGGNVYIGDSYNYCVRKVNPAGIITTIAGIGGSAGFSGDGGPATAAQLNNPGKVCTDTSGNVYIPDELNNRVRKVSPSGIITTFAGGGATLGDGGPATAAQLSFPKDLFFDSSGNLYISDYEHNRVRMVNGSGIITTVAGDGLSVFGGDGGPPTAAQLSAWGICMDGSGNLYIGDEGNYRVRKICMPPALATVMGSSVICASASVTFTTSITGGTWSEVTGNAGVTPGGVVTGITAGVDTIKYTLTNSCYFTTAVYPVTVNTVSAGSISGTGTVCAGASTTLTDPAAGGVWSTVTPFATVGAATGVVTGVSAGTAVISYSVTNSCGTATATQTVDVTGIPAVPPISGHSVICSLETTDTLTDSASGGVWSVTGGVVNIEAATGVVTGVSIGTAVISYSVTYPCGAGIATYTVTVSQIPAVAAISGHSSICIDSTITLTDSVTGGVWSRSGTALSIGAGTGIVTGLSAGTDTVWYSLTNLCGTGHAYKTIHVANCDTDAGVAPLANIPDGITLSPNPAIDAVTVTSVSSDITSIAVIDINGKKVGNYTNLKTRSVHVPLDKLPPGTYLFRVNDAVTKVVQKE